MAKLILNAYTAEKNGPFVSVALCIGGEPPFPRKIVDIARTSDAIAAFESYKAEAAQSGKPLALSMSIGRGDRCPPGFKALRAVSHFETVNL